MSSIYPTTIANASAGHGLPDIGARGCGAQTSAQWEIGPVTPAREGRTGANQPPQLTRRSESAAGCGNASEPTGALAWHTRDLLTQAEPKKVPALLTSNRGPHHCRKPFFFLA